MLISNLACPQGLDIKRMSRSKLGRGIIIARALRYRTRKLPAFAASKESAADENNPAGARPSPEEISQRIGAFFS